MSSQTEYEWMRQTGRSYQQIAEQFLRINRKYVVVDGGILAPLVEPDLSIPMYDEFAEISEKQYTYLMELYSVDSDQRSPGCV